MTRARKLAVALALLLLILLTSPLDWRGSRSEELSFYKPPETAIERLIQRAKAGEQGDELGRLPIDEELARELFGLDHPYNCYDPDAYFTHEPNLDAVRRFNEHPLGSWRMRTNSLAMRRDSEPSGEAPTLRVLVVGDSHVDGICNNSENLCAVAEAALESAHPGASVEVLNGARGGHSLWNYLGVIERHLSLAPDVVVVTIFGGNDFTDVLFLGHAFEGTKPRGLTPESKERRAQALQESRYVIGQGYGTLLFFKDRPLELDFSMEVSGRILEEISRKCRDAGAELILMYLPSPLSLSFKRAPRREPEVRTILGLGEADLALPTEIRTRLLSEAEALELDTLDLTPLLSECRDACFWQTDLHLSVKGHERVGRLLAQRLMALPEAQALLNAPREAPR